MKKFTIEITDTDVCINGTLHHFDMPMDLESHEDDLNKRAILALADRMGYEPVYLFEEMTDRLHDMLDDLDEY